MWCNLMKKMPSILATRFNFWLWNLLINYKRWCVCMFQWAKHLEYTDNKTRKKFSELIPLPKLPGYLGSYTKIRHSPADSNSSFIAHARTHESKTAPTAERKFFKVMLFNNKLLWHTEHLSKYDAPKWNLTDAWKKAGFDQSNVSIFPRFRPWHLIE